MERTYTESWDPTHYLKMVCNDCGFVYYLEGGIRWESEWWNEKPSICPHCGSLAHTTTAAWVELPDGSINVVDPDSFVPNKKVAVYTFNREGKLVNIIESI
jgi:hypothetical protein